MIPVKQSPLDLLKPYLRSECLVEIVDGIAETKIAHPSPGLLANAAYFGHPDWGKIYFENCHRDSAFKERWLAGGGRWDDKIVVDVGCGPGNLYATLGGKPKLLIGVDVSRGALEMAQSIGYTPLLADAQQMPLRSGFADIVAVNATLHHCDDMVQALTESARLVRPGGILVIDHDPQLTAWNFKGLAMFLYKVRLKVYRIFMPSLHVPLNERLKALDTEIHHLPGDGVTAEMLNSTLKPMGFEVMLYPHNQTVGIEALEGEMGIPPHWRYRWGQRLSGIDPYSSEAALSLLCVAYRTDLSL